jgi:hypothetical protein
LADRLAGLYKEAGRRPFEVTVEYRKLCVEADALVGAGNTPSLGNAFKNLLQKVTWQVRKACALGAGDGDGQGALIGVAL